MFRKGAGIIHCRPLRSSVWRHGESAKFSPCENDISDGGELTRKLSLATYGCSGQLLEKRDRDSNVLLSQLMTSSFEGNKPYSVILRFPEQRARLVMRGWGSFLQQAHKKSSNTYCYLSRSIEWEIEVQLTVIHCLPSMASGTKLSQGVEGRWLLWEKILRSNLKLDIGVCLFLK